MSIDHMPPLDHLRAWDKDPNNDQCWGLDVVADEIERLRAALQAIVDKYTPDVNPSVLHDIACEALL